MASLRAKLLNGLIHSHPRASLAPRAIASFSTRSVLHNTDNTPKNDQPNDKDAGYWKYDLSFKTQMSKAVLFAVLAGAGAVETWTWYREIRQWWTGVRDDGGQI
ncbi:hypothetical protein RU639_002482 [Aspergillus parasiticus]